ncbi:hypothetical protein EST38_g683 [Candolleomyces aberdarensis]|uniref:Actin n=1 Tax=Candolleomyces aberdarensis TaxID=2316362 RepID=A0A4Q2E0F9_9AGAR|nr:hypothetical protein EST38_g683 [Candolleomyces aberdarensis]
MVNYGGDEVCALVIDIGFSSLRAGYAGDDTPKAIIPTHYGYTPATPDADVAMGDGTDGGEASNKSKYANIYIGQNGPSIWRPGMEIGNPITDGLISDFNPIPPLIRHALQDVMRVEANEHPILVTEPTWNTPANRERMAEIMFEEFQVPAFYIANTGVLNAFAAGKGSALVIDIGQTVASVTPVVDGFVLRKGLHQATLLYSARSSKHSPGLSHSPLPRFIHGLSKGLLTNATNYRGPIELWPHQLIASKITNPSNPNQPKTLPSLITESLRACDPELRQVLMGNVVLTGGGSLFTGLLDRLNAEMARTFPHAKIHAPGNPIERRYGGWLGGSILASLGTFHQLWISKEEWQEHGKAIVGQRCK